MGFAVVLLQQSPFWAHPAGISMVNYVVDIGRPETRPTGVFEGLVSQM